MGEKASERNEHRPELDSQTWARPQRGTARRLFCPVGADAHLYQRDPAQRSSLACFGLSCIGPLAQSFANAEISEHARRGGSVE